MNIPPTMQTATEWQSHLPALLACIASSAGPVLELGVGHFSTPHLHAFCGAMGRMLVSVEEDPDWYLEFAKYKSDKHQVFGARHSLIIEGTSNGWGVAFIDHSPGGANRANAFKQLIGVSDYVVVHDAQKDAENFQHIEPLLDGVNWYLCTGYWPHTLCASKTKQIPAVLLGM